MECKRCHATMRALYKVPKEQEDQKTTFSCPQCKTLYDGVKEVWYYPEYEGVYVASDSGKIPTLGKKLKY